MGKARRRKRYGPVMKRGYTKAPKVFQSGADTGPKELPAEQQPGRNGDRTWRSLYEFLDSCGNPAVQR
jgi:hypothetical protein